MIRRVTTDLNTGQVIEDLTVHPSKHQFYYAGVLGGSRDIITTLYYQLRPAPRERSSDEMQSVCVSSVPLSQLWSESLTLVSGLF